MHNRFLGALSLAAILASAPAIAQTSTTPAQPMNPAPSTTMPSTAPATQMPTTTGTIGGMFYTTPVSTNEWVASELMGKAVYNAANERIGEIDDLIIGRDGRAVAAVVGVGGFLGIGERKVAMTFSNFRMTRDQNGTVRTVVDASRDMLKDAPEYKIVRTN
jgi:sporulation protein YlmC with PRC-barrel domain